MLTVMVDMSGMRYLFLTALNEFYDVLNSMVDMSLFDESVNGASGYFRFDLLE
jgi:hypothetical protein